MTDARLRIPILTSIVFKCRMMTSLLHGCSGYGYNRPSNWMVLNVEEVLVPIVRSGIHWSMTEYQTIAVKTSFIAL